MAKRMVNDKTGLELNAPFYQLQVSIVRVDSMNSDGRVTSQSSVRNFGADISDVEVNNMLDAVGQQPLSDDEKSPAQEPEVEPDDIADGE